MKVGGAYLIEGDLRGTGRDPHNQIVLSCRDLGCVHFGLGFRFVVEFFFFLFRVTLYMVDVIVD